jgi:polyvinyl alcohol dehydrogenase (cytochrome)
MDNARLSSFRPSPHPAPKRSLRTLMFITTVIVAGGGWTPSAGAAGTPPGTPTNLAATVDGANVALTWTNGAGALGANVYRDTVTKLWAGGYPNPTPTTFTDTGVAAGTHTYAVADYNSSGQGALSAGITVTVSGSNGSTGTTYRGNLGRSGYYPSETGLTAGDAASLKVHWTASGGVDSVAQPIVANNMIFWSDWNGEEHGTDLNGHAVWTADIGTTTPPASDNCLPPSAGPTSTPTLAFLGSTRVVYVGGGDGVFYALNARTGAIIWQTRLGSSPDNFLWDSPALYKGTIYMGVASFGDCPLVQGKLVAMDAATGAITHVANMVPTGCVGGGIWSSPAVDSSAGTVWVTTGTPHACSTGVVLAPAIVELRASDLALLGYWAVPVSSQGAGDPDFGTTPTLFTATINGQVRSLLGAANKDAIFYAWDRSNPAAGPVWQTTLATASGDPAVGSIVSASWDGSRLYVGGGNTTINGTSCPASLDALNPSTGAFVWRSCQASHMFGGITVVPGVVVEGNLAGTVVFLNATNGNTLFRFTTGLSEVQGECAVSNGIVYVPLDDGQLVALGQ